LYRLEARPVHGDEANQAYRTGILYERGQYRYDPHEHHGPTLYYATLPLLKICGATDFKSSEIWMYRLLPALAGIVLPAALLLTVYLFGYTIAGLAAAFTAVSLPFVYYSRFYIQEMLYVVFIWAFLATFLQYCRTPRLTLATLSGFFGGLAFCTKETIVLSAAAFCVGVCASFAQMRGLWDALPVSKRRQHGLFFILSAVVPVVVLYSSFGANMKGTLDAFTAFLHYAERAGGQGSAALHDKPWYYYAQLILYTYREAGPRWSEAPFLLLGIWGTLDIFAHRWRAGYNATTKENGLFILAVYTWTLFVVYSAIPYKTPWNVLSVYQPLLVLSAVGVQSLCRRIFGRHWVWGLSFLTAILLAWTLRQTAAGCFTYAADTRNPYVYAQTTTALERFVHQLDAITESAPEGKTTVVYIVKADGDYWPLPWYLRRYPRVGYATNTPAIFPPNAIVICGVESEPGIRAMLGDTYFSFLTALRPNVLLTVFVPQETWDRFIQGRGGTTATS